MTTHRAMVLSSLIASAMILGGPDASRGQEPGPATQAYGPPGPAIAGGPRALPSDLDDPPFNRYVDVLLLGRAWRGQDAALMADLGLQLAEGERVLLRPRRKVEAIQILELAAYLAADQRDGATLARLEKAASARGDRALTEHLASARKMAEATRADDHPMAEAIEKMTPQGLALHQAAIRRIRAAKFAGDNQRLDAIDKYLDTRGELHDGQQKHLDKVLGKARSASPKDAESRRATIQLVELIANATD